MSDIRIGVFGAWRGNSYIELISREPRLKLVAICDKNIGSITEHEDFKDVALFDNFDDFITEGKKLGMNAVFHFFAFEIIAKGGFRPGIPDHGMAPKA